MHPILARVLKDLTLRLAGMALLFASYDAALGSMTLVRLSPQHDPSSLAFGYAVLSFLSFCSGWCLVAIGSHVFDRVDVL